MLTLTASILETATIKTVFLQPTILIAYYGGMSIYKYNQQVKLKYYSKSLNFTK